MKLMKSTLIKYEFGLTAKELNEYNNNCTIT